MVLSEYPKILIVMVSYFFSFVNIKHLLLQCKIIKKALEKAPKGMHLFGAFRYYIKYLIITSAISTVSAEPAATVIRLLPRNASSTATSVPARADHSEPVE